MVTLTTATTPLPGIHDYAKLVLGPLLEASKVLPHVRTVRTTSTIVHLPIAAAAATGWFSEAEQITVNGDLIGEIAIAPVKAASIAALSNELANDTSPGAVGTIGDGVAETVDSAFFSGTGVPPQPYGLAALAGFTPVTSPLTTDGFADAIAAIEGAGGTASVAWMSPTDWSAITKSVTDHATVSPTGALQRSLLGVPVVTTRHVSPGTVWVADGSQVVAVVREDGEVAVSRDAAFTADSTLVRVVSRINFAFPFPATVVKLTEA